jgi:hypothetical protein
MGKAQTLGAGRTKMAKPLLAKGLNILPFTIILLFLEKFKKLCPI